MAVEWTQGLSVGDSEIDSQHKELFSRVNRLIEAMNQRKGKDEIGNVIKFLESYVIKHFGTEETRMDRLTNYPKAAIHKIQHDEFKKSFAGIKKKYNETGPTVEVVIQIHSRLGNWLMTHIPTIDKELAGYLTSN